MVETIGTRIGKLRESKKLTQQQLADDLKITREKLNSWERNERHLKDGDIIALADYFKVSTDYILGRDVPPTTDPDIESACAYTGLSMEAVSEIREMTHSKRRGYICHEAINRFFEIENNFFFIQLQRYLDTCEESKTAAEEIVSELSNVSDDCVLDEAKQVAQYGIASDPNSVIYKCSKYNNDHCDDDRAVGFELFELIEDTRRVATSFFDYTDLQLLLMKAIDLSLEHRKRHQNALKQLREK